MSKAKFHASAPSWMALAGGIALAATPATAQEDTPFSLQDTIGSDDFSIEGDLRFRYQTYDNGFRSNAPDSDEAVTIRGSIRAEYDAGPVTLGGELRDARAYLNDADTPLSASSINALELVQLYASANIGETASITGGRFVLNLGSKRLVGDPGFRTAANAFTGVRFDRETADGSNLTVFYTLPQQRLPTDKASLLDNKVEWDRESWDLEFWGGIFSRRALIGPFTGEVYVYVLDEDDRADKATVNRHLVTPGVRFYRPDEAGSWDAEFEFAYQGGNIRTSKDANAPQVDVDAYTAHAELGYSFASAWSPRISAFFDIASGDDADTSDYNRFDPLFGPRRGEWGPTELYGPFGRSNIRSVGAKIAAKPSKRLQGFLGYRHAWLDSATDTFANTKLRDPSGNAGRDGGNQVEARIRYWLVPGLVRLELGGAILDKGRFFQEVPGSPQTGATHFGYSDLTFSF